MSVDISIFLGGFLALLAGLCVQYLSVSWQRRQRAGVYRKLIALELCENLPVMDEMLRSLDRTRAAGFTIADTVIERPRVTVMSGVVIAGDNLLALTVQEQAVLVQLVGQVDRARDEYAAWPDAIGGARGVIQLRCADGTIRLGREVSTDQLRDTIDLVIKNHLFFLVTLVNRLSERSLASSPLLKLHRALRPSRTSKQLQISTRTSDVKQLTGVDRSKPLIVWEHDRQHHPMQVIELKSLIE